MGYTPNRATPKSCYPFKKNENSKKKLKKPNKLKKKKNVKKTIRKVQKTSKNNSLVYLLNYKIKFKKN